MAQYSVDIVDSSGKFHSYTIQATDQKNAVVKGTQEFHNDPQNRDLYIRSIDVNISGN